MCEVEKNIHAGYCGLRFATTDFLFFDKLITAINKMNATIYAEKRIIKISRANLNKIRVFLIRILVKLPNNLNKFAVRNFSKRFRAALADFIRLKPYFMIKIKSSLDGHREVRQKPLQITAIIGLKPPTIRCEFALDAN